MPAFVKTAEYGIQRELQEEEFATWCFVDIPAEKLYFACLIANKDQHSVVIKHVQDFDCSEASTTYSLDCQYAQEHVGFKWKDDCDSRLLRQPGQSLPNYASSSNQ